MRRSPARDLLVGCFVLAGMLALAWLSIRVGGLGYEGPGGLVVTAGFDELGGLKERRQASVREAFAWVELKRIIPAEKDRT